MYLSREQNPPISVMVLAGGVAPLVAALDRDDWSVGNIDRRAFLRNFQMLSRTTPTVIPC
jgi:hypothetical protein